MKKFEIENNSSIGGRKRGEIMKDWKTSIVGIALIIGGIYTGVTGVASWTEVLSVVTTGLGFILSKDFK